MQSSAVGRIAGIVSDSSRRPIVDATISVVGTRFIAISDAQGRFVIAVVPVGSYALRVQRIGRRATRVSDLQVRAGETSTADITMSAAAVQLGGVVVSASRQAERLTDAPASVTRIDASDIANTFGNSFVPSLRDVEGIDYNQIGVTSATINARGFNSSANNRVLMMEDGRVDVLVASGLPVGGQTTIPKVDLAGIEVVLGPGSALYGPDATNGVLTLQTKDPREYQGTTFEVSGGNHAFRDFQLRHAGVSTNGRVGYKVSGEYLSTNDFQNQLRYANDIDERGIGGAVDWATDVARGEGGLVYYRGAQRYEVNAGASQSNGVAQTITGRDQLVNAQYRHAQFKWSAPRWYASVYATQSMSGKSFAIDRFSTVRAATPATIRDDSIARLSDFPSVGRLYAADVQHSVDLPRLRRTHVIVGAQLRRDEVNSRREWLTDRLTSENVALYQGGLYAQSETPLSPEWRLVAAARIDKGTAYRTTASPK
ncbi:MAG: TonB-dependent receptor, partial [Gemmatimonadaceae bacterium]